MNEIIIQNIQKKYSISPYYNLNNFISINDDRIGRIVSFRLYIVNNEIFVDFKESSQMYQLISYNYKTETIKSLEEFINKWTKYYNFN
jgi:hypothetical protein